jgi:hypothetical protein
MSGPARRPPIVVTTPICFAARPISGDSTHLFQDDAHANAESDTMDDASIAVRR